MGENKERSRWYDKGSLPYMFNMSVLWISIGVLWTVGLLHYFPKPMLLTIFSGIGMLAATIEYLAARRRRENDE